MTDDDLTTVRVDQFLAHSPAKVWRALTDPELIAPWLIPGDFRLAGGPRHARPRAAGHGVLGHHQRRGAGLRAREDAAHRLARRRPRRSERRRLDHHLRSEE